MKKAVSLGICLLLLACLAAVAPSSYAATGAGPQSGSPPAASAESCGSIPDDVSGSITPKCGQQNTEFVVEVYGFDSEEQIGYWLDGDYGVIVGTGRPDKVDDDGKFKNLSFYPYKLALKPGLYYWVFRGIHSRHEAIVYFRVTAEVLPKDSCSALPAAVSGSITPACGGWYTEFTMTVWDFSPDEPVGYYLDGDYGVIPTAKLHTYAGSSGRIGMAFHTYDYALEPGLYFWVFRGEWSGHQAILYFRVGEEVVAPDQSCGRISAPQHGKISPWCGGQDTTFTMDIWGFLPYEPVGYWLDGQYGVIAGTVSAPTIGGSGSEIMTFRPADFALKPGLYFWVFQGVYSGHQSIIYFRVR